MKHLSAFLQGIPGEFAVVGLVLAVLGLIVLWMKSRQTRDRYGADVRRLCAVCDQL